MPYIVNGMHVRREGVKGEKITYFKNGENIVPTDYELKEFKNKFRFVPDVEEPIEVPEEDGEIDYTELDNIKEIAKPYIDEPEKYDAEGIEKLKKLVAKVPQKKDNVDKLVTAITKLLETLEDGKEA